VAVIVVIVIKIKMTKENLEQKTKNKVVDILRTTKRILLIDADEFEKSTKTGKILMHVLFATGSGAVYLGGRVFAENLYNLRLMQAESAEYTAGGILLSALGYFAVAKAHSAFKPVGEVLDRMNPFRRGDYQ